MKLTQPFGVDWTGGQIPLGNGKYGDYSALGLKGHNGWDLSAGSNTEALAVADGIATYFQGGSGYGNNLRLIVDVDTQTKLECVYGHLNADIKTGPVKAGEVIVFTGNTGASTAPHLHYGQRVQKLNPKNGEFEVINYDNGFFGYVNPDQFYPKTIFDLPVDNRYGNTKPFATEVDFYATNWWFRWKFKRLMNVREYNAFRFGAWDLRTVFDPAFLDVWTEMTKPEAMKRGIVK